MTTSDSTPDGPWYRDGLQFTCSQCGDCCTGAPGFVWVSEVEIEEIATLTGKSVGEIRLMHTRKIGAKTSLTEFANGDCTFFDGQTRQCKIYAARPAQCRTWPFWNSNLTSTERWLEVCEVCPGAGRGSFVPLEEIRRKAEIVDI